MCSGHYQNNVSFMFAILFFYADLINLQILYDVILQLLVDTLFSKSYFSYYFQKLLALFFCNLLITLLCQDF
jgi:hypothetical protein